MKIQKLENPSRINSTGLKSKIDEAKATPDEIAEEKKLVEFKLRIAEDRYNRNNVMSDLLASKQGQERTYDRTHERENRKLEESVQQARPLQV